MAVTQDVVMNFLLEQGGKVKNAELLKKFKPVVDCPDPQEKANNRERFKRFVNNIAVVREEDGVKVVVLKKKYTHLLAGFVQSPNPQEEGEIQSKGDLEEEAQPLPESDNTQEPLISSDTERSSQQDSPEPQDHNSDSPEPQDHNSDSPEPQDHNSDSPEPQDHNSDSPEPQDHNSDSPEPQDHGLDSEAVETLQESVSQEDLISFQKSDPENEEPRESVFDIVSRMDHSGPVPVPKSWSDAQAKELQKPHMLPLRYAQTSFDSLEANQDKNTSVLLKIPIPVIQESPPLNPPLSAMPRSPHLGRRHQDDVGSRSPHTKRASKTMKASEENKYSDVVPLIQHDHEWLVSATNGRCNHKLLGLLLTDSELADKRDFISGFTALHWAAKSGNTEMIKLLFDLSRKGGSNINVNVRSFGGYTPLHIAAIHERKDVIIMLVSDYSANINIRDNNGKKPYHYLKKGAVPLRYILKDPALAMEHAIPLKRNSKVGVSILGTTSTFLGVISDDIAFHDLTRGIRKPSSLNKFFTAPSGAKKKLKARDSYPTISSLSEEPEQVEEVAGKRRPVSDLFTH